MKLALGVRGIAGCLDVGFALDFGVGCFPKDNNKISSVLQLVMKETNPQVNNNLKNRLT